MARILLIKREAGLRECWSRNLAERIGEEVQVESSAGEEDALAKLGGLPGIVFDLVVSGWPEMLGGKEPLISRIRKRYPGLPVIVFTGGQPETDQRWALGLGITEVVSQPYTKALAMRVRQYLSPPAGR